MRTECQWASLVSELKKFKIIKKFVISNCEAKREKLFKFESLVPIIYHLLLLLLLSQSHSIIILTYWPLEWTCLAKRIYWLYLLVVQWKSIELKDKRNTLWNSRDDSNGDFKYYSSLLRMHCLEGIWIKKEILKEILMSQDKLVLWMKFDLKYFFFL